MYNDTFTKKPKTSKTCIACEKHLPAGEPRYSTYQEGDSWYWCEDCFSEASQLLDTGNGEDYLRALNKHRGLNEENEEEDEEENEEEDEEETEEENE